MPEPHSTYRRAGRTEISAQYAMFDRQRWSHCSDDPAAFEKRIAEQKEVPVAPRRAVLEKLGTTEIVIEEIPKRLAAADDELLLLRQDLMRLRNDRPELAAIRGQALASSTLAISTRRVRRLTAFKPTAAF